MWPFCGNVDKLPDFGSFNGSFQHHKRFGQKLTTVGCFDGTKTIVTQTADLCSFNGTFQQGGSFGQQTADLGSFDGIFQQS